MFKAYPIYFYIILFSFNLFCAQTELDCYPPIPANYWQYHTSPNVVIETDNSYNPFEIEIKKPGFLNGEVKRKDLDSVIFYFNHKSESYIVDIFTKARNENKYIIFGTQLISEPPHLIGSKEVAKTLIKLGANIIASNWLEIDINSVKITKKVFGSLHLEYSIYQIKSKIKLEKKLAEQIASNIKSAKKEGKTIIFINTDYLNNELKQKWLSIDYFIKFK